MLIIVVEKFHLMSSQKIFKIFNLGLIFGIRPEKGNYMTFSSCKLTQFFFQILLNVGKHGAYHVY
jgi:hypothetical protein